MPSNKESDSVAATKNLSRCTHARAETTYHAEVLQVSTVTSLLQDRPGLLGELVGNIVQIKLAVLGAVHGFVALGSYV